MLFFCNTYPYWANWRIKYELFPESRCNQSKLRTFLVVHSDISSQNTMPLASFSYISIVHLPFILIQWPPFFFIFYLYCFYKKYFLICAPHYCFCTTFGFTLSLVFVPREHLKIFYNVYPCFFCGLKLGCYLFHWIKPINF